ncbi:antibiotic biosynthesis monooxygenase [Streptomyces sp. AD681]|uniref:Antibiotic biosynthesis monooxygenase n=1 Tax=Streptomyces rubrogriseus TaxID=194673 RepID=A0A6G3TQN7_9ACTN|nr:MULTISPECIES: antibiotic biosynthesis monooxygenase family protein [Streptomyces]MDA5142614.1 antibiotic biosynthesis monooxygenase [Streptomyces sp. AD681]MYS70421.1 antibiotic biosynthesis monooxygenase [Streptomyces sp. SID5926]NEC38944.1 antibiotic biosynthesis monooxygenase [Streptomyces rubrogriseus]
MLIEHTLLSVKPDQQESFEKVFTEAQQVLAKAPGFQFVDLLRETSEKGTYLLITAWATDREGADGFRASPLFQQWNDLLTPHLAASPDSSFFSLLAHYPN